MMNKGHVLLSQKHQTEDTHLTADAEEPHLSGGTQQTHLLAVTEEDDASKRQLLNRKKGKKRKRSELVEVKKENQISDAEKTEVPADTTEPTSEGGSSMINNQQTHLPVVPEEDDASKRLLLKRKKGKKRKSSELVEVKKEHELGDAEKTQVPADIEDCPLRWRASYSSQLLKRLKRVYKGSILINATDNHAILYDADELNIDSRYLKVGEVVYPGLLLEFPCYMAQIHERILQSKEDIAGHRTERRYEKNRKRMKKRPADKMVRSPQANLIGSSLGMFARVAALRKSMSPQAQRRISESPFVPAHVRAVFSRRRPRKLKSEMWKEFIPIYENGRIAEGQCKHCNKILPASKRSGTNHIRKHLKQCAMRSSMHEMVEKMCASTSSPQVTVLDDWSFSQKECRRNLANMIVQHGLPFSIVDYSGFRKFVKSLNPMFKMVSRTVIRDDCMESYKEQRSMLREILQNYGARVSITGDMWTSNQRLGYLCITCHYIDKTWKLQKRILRFCMMEMPHSGFRMYNVMLKSLQYWNIEDKICSITLDNASVNGTMMDHLRDNLTKKQMLFCGGELFHIRCAAHVLNLIVQDGLLVMKGSIDKIRDSVKYVKSSQAREQLFDDIVKELGIICEKEPSLDIVTRWNSTYMMIDSALPYKEAFDELVEQDRQFKYAPSAADWEMAEAIRSLLKIFFEATKVVSGSNYPTANRYFHEIWSVRQLLETNANNENPIIASMVSQMQKKFDKYWKESYLANCIPVIFDPRYKLALIEYRIKQAFGADAEEQLKKVDMILKALFKEYSHELGVSLATDPSEEEAQDDGDAEVNNPVADWEAYLKVQKKQEANELDRYLTDGLFPRPKKQEANFDILGWWEMHSPKYPVISCIARDVLAIQASTVASESSFSAGGRVITDHRSRLKSETVEGLLCLQDWLNAADSKPTNKDPTNKDVVEEVQLVFNQESEYQEDTALSKLCQ